MEKNIKRFLVRINSNCFQVLCTIYTPELLALIVRMGIEKCLIRAVRKKMQESNNISIFSSTCEEGLDINVFRGGDGNSGVGI